MALASLRAGEQGADLEVSSPPICAARFRRQCQVKPLWFQIRGSEGCENRIRRWSRIDERLVQLLS